MPSKHREEGVCKVKSFRLQLLYLSAHNFCRLFITKQFWPSHSSLSHQKGFKAHMLLQHLHCHLRIGTQSSLQPLQHYPQHTHTLLQLPLRCTDTNGQNYQVYTKQEKSVHLIFTIKAVEAQFKRTLYNSIASGNLPPFQLPCHRSLPLPPPPTSGSSQHAQSRAPAQSPYLQEQHAGCMGCSTTWGRGMRVLANPEPLLPSLSMFGGKGRGGQPIQAEHQALLSSQRARDQLPRAVPRHQVGVQLIGYLHMSSPPSPSALPGMEQESL